MTPYSRQQRALKSGLDNKVMAMKSIYNKRPSMGVASGKSMTMKRPSMGQVANPMMPKRAYRAVDSATQERRDFVAREGLLGKLVAPGIKTTAPASALQSVKAVPMAKAMATRAGSVSKGLERAVSAISSQSKKKSAYTTAARMKKYG